MIAPAQWACCASVPVALINMVVGGEAEKEADLLATPKF